MPKLPYVLYILDLGTKGNKNVYFSTIESGDSILKQVQENWPKHLNDDITFGTVTKGFKNIKTKAPSVYQHFNNFKLLHRRTVHKKCYLKREYQKLKTAFSAKQKQKQSNIFILNEIM